MYTLCTCIYLKRRYIHIPSWLVQYMTNLAPDHTVVVVLSCSLWRVTDDRAEGEAILVDQPDLLLFETFSFQDHLSLCLSL